MGSHPTWLELAAWDDGVYEAGAGAALFDDALAAAVRQLRAAAFAAPRPLSSESSSVGKVFRSFSFASAFVLASTFRRAPVNPVRIAGLLRRTEREDGGRRILHQGERASSSSSCIEATSSSSR